MHHREHTCESETEERSRSCPQPTFRFVFSFIWGEPCRKLPTSLRTFARRCCPLCSPLLRKQKVPSCMKLWEHLFLFFLFFSLWGWGEARRGEEEGGEERRSDAISADVLKIRSQTRDPTWPLRLKRWHFFLSFFFFSVPWKLFPANSTHFCWLVRCRWFHEPTSLSSTPPCTCWSKKTQEACDL